MSCNTGHAFIFSGVKILCCSKSSQLDFYDGFQLSLANSA